MTRVFEDITLGRRLDRVATPRFSLAEVSYARDTVMPDHAHRRANVTLVLAGEFEEVVGGRAYDVGPGSVVVKPAGTAHRNAFDGAAARSFVIELHDARPSRCAWLAPGPAARAAFDVYAAFRRVTGEHASLADSRLAPAVARLFAALRRDRTPHPRRPEGWERDACALLETHPVERAAAELGDHRVRFTRRFRRGLGCSPREYRRRRRLARALELLASTDVALVDVALRAGYCDQSHLTRATKRDLGLTPSVYRRLVRRAD